VKLGDLTAAERRQIQRGHFKPALARAAIANPRTTQRAPVDQVARYRCHTCKATSPSWPAAEAHVDDTRHYRVDALLEQLP
jgi:hypothetical protein